MGKARSLGEDQVMADGDVVELSLRRVTRSSDRVVRSAFVSLA
jgi:hypothetical protein